MPQGSSAVRPTNGLYLYLYLYAEKVYVLVDDIDMSYIVN
jgi:hypothetical protein